MGHEDTSMDTKGVEKTKGKTEEILVEMISREECGSSFMQIVQECVSVCVRVNMCA